MNESSRTAPATSSATSSSSAEGADTRAALLEAGRVLFAEEGFDGASVRALTARAGVNLGAVTYHFGSKRALYEAVLAAEVGAVGAAVQAAAAGEGSALDRITAVVEAYFRVLAEHPHLPRLMLQELAAGRLPPEPVTRTFRGIAATLGHLQADGEADGSVRPGNPLLTALSVVAQPIYMNLVRPVIEPVLGVDVGDPAFQDTLIRHAADFVRGGLAPRPESST